MIKIVADCHNCNTVITENDSYVEFKNKVVLCWKCKQSLEKDKDFNNGDFSPYNITEIYVGNNDREQLDKIDTDHQDDVTCPYCGHKDDCSYELFTVPDDGDVEKVCCDECGKDYLAKIHVKFTYSTEKFDL